MQALRLAARPIRRNPRGSVVAIAVIGLALGATVGIGTVVDHAVLRPLPYPQPDQLVVVWNTYPHWRDRDVLSRFWDRIDLSFPEYEALRARDDVFADVAIYRTAERVLTQSDRSDVIRAGAATHALLRVLGVAPVMGRWLSAADDRPGAAPVAVIRHEFWQASLGGDAAAIGGTLRLDGEDHTIVGVLPAGFRFSRVEDARSPDVWTSLGRVEDPTNDGNHSFMSIARLRDDMSIEQAHAVSVAVLRGERRPETRGARVIAREEYERGGARPMMLLFSGAVGVLLLLACATVATMQLARVAERGSEIAVRMALGASRARIAAQLLMENALLGLAGSAVGVVLAHATVGTLIRLMPVETPGIAGARLDLRILLFALALALLTAMIFGLAPMLHAARHEPAATLRTARGTTGGRSLLVLVGVQSALAVLLLAGAALLVRTVSTLSAVDPGFATEQQLTFGVNLTADRYTPERRELWFEELSTRIGALPGVTAVEATSVLPLSGESASNSVWMESYGPESGAKPEAERRIVTEGFFASMRIPLLRGRAFAAGDEASSTPVMIVSRTATEHLWRDRDAIGDRVELDDRWWTVVGVVDDVRDRALSAPPLATVYVPAAQWRPRARSFMVRTERPPLQLAGAVQTIVRAMDPEVAVRDVRTMQQVAAASAQPERARAILLGGYAVLAALLALAGLYGVASFGTQQRAREFAIRSALGARTWSIVELAMRRTVFASYGGAMAGLALSLALGGVLRRFLYGVEPWDPAALATAVIALSVFAVATAAGPALRSARVNPTEILGRQ